MRTSRRFRPDIPEIPRSRHFVAEVLRCNGTTPTDAVLLVASELVTNAVRHGSGDVELRVEIGPGDVRLEVLDEGHADVRLAPTKPPPTALGGRGLHLVSEVSRRWGSDIDDAGRTVVWAELEARAMADSV